MFVTHSSKRGVLALLIGFMNLNCSSTERPPFEPKGISAYLRHLETKICCPREQSQLWLCTRCRCGEVMFQIVILGLNSYCVLYLIWPRSPHNSADLQVKHIAASLVTYQLVETTNDCMVLLPKTTASQARIIELPEQSLTPLPSAVGISALGHVL